MRPRLLAIDWSGAQNLAGGQIAVAKLEPWSSSPRLLPTPEAGYWKRTDILEFLQKIAEGGAPTIAGIDCNFTLPFAGGKYTNSVTAKTAQELWREIDDECSDSEDLHGRKFGVERPCQEGQTGFWLGGNQPENLGFRATEKIAKGCGEKPNSPFQLFGGGHVGTGGLAGMRMLNRLQDAKGASVWPFDERDAAAPLTVVEIYPALFKTMLGLSAQNFDDSESVLRNLNTALTGCDFDCVSGVTAPLDDHQFDALASVAGMAVVMCDRKVWAPLEMSEQARRTEGWIFGVGADWTGL